jgi:hypothetical protein
MDGLFSLINQLEQQIIQHNHDRQNLMKAVLHEVLYLSKEEQHV